MSDVGDLNADLSVFVGSGWRCCAGAGGRKIGARVWRDSDWERGWERWKSRFGSCSELLGNQR